MPLSMNCLPWPRGFLCMMSLAGGSRLSASAGKVSLTRLIQRMCMGSRGIPRLLIEVTKSSSTSPRLVDSRKRMVFRMLSYMRRPSATADTMVTKLSSESIMSEASLATSVPVMPMETPMSAFLSAGASFTPSPVIATMSPLFCHADTIFIFCSGAMRA